jgi:hypothetical protein
MWRGGSLSRSTLTCRVTVHQALLLAPPWTHPSFSEHLSWWKTVKYVVIESPGFVVWPPTRHQFERVKDVFTAQLADCCISQIVIMCAYGEELSDDSLGVVGRELKDTPWEDGIEGVNDFFVPQDTYISNGGVYSLKRGCGGDWITCGGELPKVYKWSNDYTGRIDFVY